MRFLNRASELSMLRRRLSGDSAEFLIVYGRRRVGKTELLTHLASDLRSFYFEATDTVAAQQLRDISDELARVSGIEMLRAQSLSNWDAVPGQLHDPTLYHNILHGARISRMDINSA